MHERVRQHFQRSAFKPDFVGVVDGFGDRFGRREGCRSHEDGLVVVAHFDEAASFFKHGDGKRFRHIVFRIVVRAYDFGMNLHVAGSRRSEFQRYACRLHGRDGRACCFVERVALRVEQAHAVIGDFVEAFVSDNNFIGRFRANGRVHFAGEGFDGEIALQLLHCCDVGRPSGIGCHDIGSKHESQCAIGRSGLERNEVGRHGVCCVFADERGFYACSVENIQEVAVSVGVKLGERHVDGGIRIFRTDDERVVHRVRVRTVRASNVVEFIRFSGFDNGFARSHDDPVFGFHQNGRRRSFNAVAHFVDCIYRICVGAESGGVGVGGGRRIVDVDSGR